MIVCDLLVFPYGTHSVVNVRALVKLFNVYLNHGLLHKASAVLSQLEAIEPSTLSDKLATANGTRIEFFFFSKFKKSKIRIFFFPFACSV